ncbi:uncharacterized protein TNCV_4931001 [Trichonephila clavipes]|nr:uncharacterized protein TNCV_4931001 [Trichonephila clavipes]
MLVRLPRAPVLSGGLRCKTQLFSGTLYMAASSKTPPHQSKGPQKFKTPLQVPVFPGSSPLCHHTKSIRHVKTVVYRSQVNGTERVNLQMIANYVSVQHDTWDPFLRVFAYAIRTVVNETTRKPPAELFLGRKLITPFQKFVLVSDGTEFAVADIEKLFDEAKRNTKG